MPSNTVYYEHRKVMHHVICDTCEWWPMACGSPHDEVAGRVPVVDRRGGATCEWYQNKGGAPWSVLYRNPKPR